MLRNKIANTNCTSDKYVFSDGKKPNTVLIRRLETTILKTWSKELNRIVDMQPNMILKKHTAALPFECNLHVKLITIIYNFNDDMFDIFYLVLDFWKAREKQFLEFYEQINKKEIYYYLSHTKNPVLDVYRKIINTTVSGKKKKKCHLLIIKNNNYLTSNYL